MIPPYFYNDEIIMRGPNMNRWPVLHILSSIPTDLVIVHLKVSCRHRNIFLSMKAYVFFSQHNAWSRIPVCSFRCRDNVIKVLFFRWATHIKGCASPCIITDRMCSKRLNWAFENLLLRSSSRFFCKILTFNNITEELKPTRTLEHSINRESDKRILRDPVLINCVCHIS